MRNIVIATATTIVSVVAVLGAVEAADLYTAPPPAAEAPPPAEEAPPPVAEAPLPIEVAPPALAGGIPIRALAGAIPIRAGGSGIAGKSPRYPAGQSGRRINIKPRLFGAFYFLLSDEVRLHQSRRNLSPWSQTSRRPPALPTTASRRKWPNPPAATVRAHDGRGLYQREANLEVKARAASRAIGSFATMTAPLPFRLGILAVRGEL